LAKSGCGDPRPNPREFASICGAFFCQIKASVRTRLDKLLVDRGLVSSRERAQRLILAGEVWLGDKRLDKPGTLVDAKAEPEVRGADIPYVSRGGLKLEGALSAFQLDVRGMVAADIGASTGGFSDCLLQRGARRVFAIDVGYGQLAWKLRQDSRVTLFERANIRHFDVALINEPIDLVVIDVSFISLRLVLPTARALLRPTGALLALVKPQFEVGREHVGSGGVVRDPLQHQSALATIRSCGEALGLRCLGECESPIVGAKGNREFFLYFTRGADDVGANDAK